MPDVFGPGTPGFADACDVFNSAARSTPACVVRCHRPADVQHALRLARDQGRVLTVRAGGHSVGGFCLAPGAVVADVRPMNAVTVDGGLLHVGGGALFSDVLATGAAAVGPFDPRVGFAGFTLGGGYGLLTRLHGLGADQLAAADVVTADGSHGPAEPELLWALRGAGAGLAVVTRLTVKHHALPPLTVARVSYPLSHLRPVLAQYRAFVAGAADATTVYLGVLTSRNGDGSVQLIAHHFGADPDRVLAPLATWGPTRTHERRPIAYAAAHAADPLVFPAGQAHRWRAHFFEALPDGLDALATCGQDHWAVVEHLGGAMAHGDSAFAHRKAAFGVVSAVVGPSAVAFQDQLDAALRPHAIGSYVNYLRAAPTPTDIAAAYGANLLRLQTLKLRYDPDRVFWSPSPA